MCTVCAGLHHAIINDGNSKDIKIKCKKCLQNFKRMDEIKEKKGNAQGTDAKKINIRGRQFKNELGN